ncbi:MULTISPECIES: hemerythrin domain-containing protein [unclassified Phenylobacterium]|uniref:hemerythrin domain-containing protein n=1 Tax=unclassified Phenylobacterium TaxID=2640670 RepID=UPI0009E9F3C5|nr:MULTISPECIES: hemerythrin domain-containing protein [unclassified Phenylobacterium]
MSIIDKALGAVTPPESEKAQAKATAEARALATPGDWLSLALDHHDEIRTGFDACRKARTGPARVKAMQALGLVLNGHSLAEEVVLYPAFAKAGHKPATGLAYTEQTTAKMQMAELERIDPTTEAWKDKLEHIRGAVLHHIFEEESTWFPALKTDYDDQAHLDRRFHEESERHVVGPAKSVIAEARSIASEASLKR